MIGRHVIEAPRPAAPAFVQRRTKAAMWRIRLSLIPYLVTDPTDDPVLRAVLHQIDEDLSEIARAVDGAPPAPSSGAVYDHDAAIAALGGSTPA